MNTLALKKVVMPFIIVLSVNLNAAGYDISGQIGQNVEFDDNFLLQEEKLKTWVYHLSPSIYFIKQERTGATSVTADFDIRRHSQFKASDSENVNLQFAKNWLRPQSSYSVSMGYRIRDQRDGAEEDLGEFESTNRVETFSFSPSMSYQYSELDLIGIDFSVTNRRYSQATTDDSKSYGIGASWSKQVGPLQNISSNIRYSEFNTEGAIEDSKNKNLSLGVGYSFEPYEWLKVNANLGLNKSKSHQFDEQTLLFIDRNSTGGLFSLALQHETPLGNNVYTVSRDFSSTSSGEVVRKDRLGYKWTYRSTVKSSLALDLRWIRSKEENGEREYYTFSSSYTYDLREDIFINLIYDYRNQRREGEGSADANSIIVKLNHKF